MENPTESMIRALEHRRFDLVVSGDWDGFAALCDEHLRYIHSSGVIDTRASYLDKLRGGFYDYHRIDTTIDRVEVTVDAALIWGTMSAEVRAGERELTLDNVVGSAWVRRDESWLLISHQSTPV